MRLEGKIKRWVDDRGFGFIELSQSEDEVFVHISSFPKGEIRPQIGDSISFEIQTVNSDKKRAVKVIRNNNSYSKPVRDLNISRKNSNNFKGGIVLIFVMIMAYLVNKTDIAQYISNTLSSDRTADVPDTFKVNAFKFDTAQQSFKCDGRQHCSQMNSRSEAEYFINHCPNTKMDGDGDGVPCENDSRF